MARASSPASTSLLAPSTRYFQRRITGCPSACSRWASSTASRCDDVSMSTSHPGRPVGAGVEEHAGPVRGHRDAVTEAAAHVVLDLVLADGLDRVPDTGLIVERDRHPPVVVCHRGDSTGPRPASGPARDVWLRP